MESRRLLAKGNLAKYLGESALEMDIFARSINFRK